MKELKEKLAYSFLEVLNSYELGTPLNTRNLVLFMKLVENNNLDKKQIDYIKVTNVFI